MESVEARFQKVKTNIEAAAARSNRSAADISIVCVTKQAKIDDIVNVVRLGVFHIGENRVQEAEKKRAALKIALNETDFLRITWHLVGHLQTNKVSRAMGFADLIQSVDSVRLAEIINTKAEKAGRHIDILIQINISGEDSKFGIKGDTLPAFIEKLMPLSSVRMKGLMGIGPFVDDKEHTRRCFRRLKEMFDSANKILDARSCPAMSVLSMGMSDDYEVAIEEGSNMVRIGRAIFGG